MAEPKKKPGRGNRNAFQEGGAEVVLSSRLPRARQLQLSGDERLIKADWEFEVNII